MNPFSTSATRSIHRLAAIAVVFPAARRLNAAAAGTIRALLDDSFPLAAAHIDLLAFDNRLANGVANFSMLSFIARLVSRVAFVSIASPIDRLADVVAHSLIACFIRWLINRVAFVAIARLSIRHFDCIRLSAIARLLDRASADARNVFIAHLINRFLHCEAFVTELSFVDVATAVDWYLLAHSIVASLIAGDLTLVINNFSNCFVTSIA